jgi:hypothetical protein
MAMANAGFDGTVTEADYAYMWAVGGQDGVESAAAWKVTQGTGRQISCAAQSGRAFAKGVVSKDTAANLVSLSTPTNGGWYLICRHIDWTANTVTVIALTGPTTTTTLPTVPPVDYSSVTGMASSPGATYDHPLAWAWVRSSDTTMVIFDLRRVPGSASDLTELATLGGSEGDTKIVREGGATFIRSSGVWVQRTIATFATTTDRDTAYAKASAAYRAQNAQARDLSTMSVSTYFALYNASSNPGGAKAAGWYPTSLGPSGRMARSTTAAPLATNGWAVLAASAFSDTVAGADKAVGMPTNWLHHLRDQEERRHRNERGHRHLHHIRIGRNRRRCRCFRADRSRCGRHPPHRHLQWRHRRNDIHVQPSGIELRHSVPKAHPWIGRSPRDRCLASPTARSRDDFVRGSATWLLARMGEC